MTSGIYQITNTITGDIYVGQSKNIAKRWDQHIFDLTARTHPVDLLQNLYDTHGLESFSFQILEVCSVTNLEAKEKQAINTIKPTANRMHKPAPHECVGIGALRVAAGLSITFVIRRVGISHFVLYVWEHRGTRLNKKSTFKTWQKRYKLAELYGCTEEDIDRAFEETRQWHESQQQAS